MSSVKRMLFTATALIALSSMWSEAIVKAAAVAAQEAPANRVGGTGTGGTGSGGGRY